MIRRAPFLLEDDRLEFPPPDSADASGLLAVGGDLEPERLLAAYRAGIFPWPLLGAEGPMLWYSPDPRLVLYPERLRVTRSLAREVRRRSFDVTVDTRFREVMTACAENQRPGQQGTWITEPLIDAFDRLHGMGHAHSVECWVNGELAGGLYGVAVGGAFFGESMFTRQSNASKVAFVHLVRCLERWEYAFVDCQQVTGHLLRFGAEEMSRARFLLELEAALDLPGRPGSWRSGNRRTPTSGRPGAPRPAPHGP